jgi:2-isopropylmalate synthase
MPEFRSEDLIYDWNKPPDKPAYELKLNDETLRDGLQSPSITDPPIEEKVKILHLMEELGIYSCDIGLPGAGPQAFNDTLALATEIARSNLEIAPYAAARTVIHDIIPVAEIAQKTGLKMQAALFLFSSPIRQLTEDWTDDKMLEVTEKAIAYAHQQNLSVMYVTEDTTRARPQTLERLYQLAIDMDVERLCIADTVGHASPSGVRRIVDFVCGLVRKSGKNIGVDWHGHKDRGLDVVNAIHAFYQGADRIHGCALGIGERVGNTPLDLLMVNFKLLGVFDHDLTKLPEYVRTVSQACNVPIPDNYPVFGADAFRTATGVHADAIIKAYKKGDHWLANRIYSGVPADEFGLEQVIEVGPMSGKSNVRFWLEKHGYEANDALVDRIFDKAKRASALLTDEQIKSVADDARGG